MRFREWLANLLTAGQLTECQERIQLLEANLERYRQIVDCLFENDLLGRETEEIRDHVNEAIKESDFDAWHEAFRLLMERHEEVRTDTSRAFKPYDERHPDYLRMNMLRALASQAAFRAMYNLKK